MSNPRENLLCRYDYTPLDQLAAYTPAAQPGSQRFYLKERLHTEIQGTRQHSIMQHGEQLLAQLQQEAGTLHSQLLATDQQRSILALLDATRPHHLAYTPYGHRVVENGLLSLLAFNGERPDPVTGCYLLGNGYRAFNPVLMRFLCPDSWSPFGWGGLNAYGYCEGDPINRTDPNGHSPFSRFMRFITKPFRSKSPAPTAPAHKAPKARQNPPGGVTFAPGTKADGRTYGPRYGDKNNSSAPAVSTLPLNSTPRKFMSNQNDRSFLQVPQSSGGPKRQLNYSAPIDQQSRSITRHVTILDNGQPLEPGQFRIESISTDAVLFRTSRNNYEIYKIRDNGLV